MRQRHVKSLFSWISLFSMRNREMLCQQHNMLWGSRAREQSIKSPGSAVPGWGIQSDRETREARLRCNHLEKEEWRPLLLWLIQDSGCELIRGSIVEAEREEWWGRRMRLVSGQPRYVRLGCSGEGRFYWSPLKIESRAWAWFNVKIPLQLCEGLKRESKATRRNYCSFRWLRVCGTDYGYDGRKMVSIGSMSLRAESLRAESLRATEYTAQLWSGQRTSWGRAEMRDGKLKISFQATVKLRSS